MGLTDHASQALQDRSTETVRVVGLTTGALLFTGLWAVGNDLLIDLPGIVRIIIGAMSLAGVVALLDHLLLRLRAQPILGQWVYESTSGNWGLAEIRLVGSSLSYSVELFDNEQNLRKAVTHATASGVNGSGLLGHTVSTFVGFEEGNLFVRYEIKYAGSNYSPRSGILMLMPRIGGRGMTGYWTSTSDGQGERQGQLAFVRTGQYAWSKDVP